MNKTLKSTSELFSAESTVTVEKAVGADLLTVKGFASVETVDRSLDFVPSTEFNVKSFMAKPVLLYNHKYWIDEKGNEVAIGKPTEMYVAELAAAEDEDNYVVLDYYSREVKDYFPKEKSPDLKEGDKGLWVIAEVSVKDVAEMVERGELNAFSWRGLTRVKYVELPDGTEQKVLTDIDLFEVSLVSIPANGQATLSIAKSEGYEYANVDGFTVQSVKMEKKNFENVGMVSAYLEGHRLDYDKMREDSDSYISVQRSLQEFDPDSLISLKLTDGVSIVAGHLTTKSAPRGWQAESLTEECLEQLSETLSSEQKEPIMAKKKTSRKATAVAEPEVDATATDIVEEPIVEATTTPEDESAEEAEAAEAAEAADVVEDLTDSSEETTEDSPIVEAAAEQMDNGTMPDLPQSLEALAQFVGKSASSSIETSFKESLAPALEKIAETLSGVNNAVTSLEEKMLGNVVESTTEDTDTDADTNTEAQATSDDTDAIAKSLESLQEQMLAIAKSYPDSVRDEIIQKQQAGTANSCFDNLWPFISK